MRNNRNFLTTKLMWLTLFAVAMGLLEAAVVVYLREIYYPEGFRFPLQIIDNHIIATTELLREVATVVMLASVGYFFGRNFISRFAGFLFSFAIWDLFYYVFLKLLLDWPASLLTWDVLFLLPITWTGPVLAPIIVSITMIYYAFSFLSLDHKVQNVKFGFRDWLLLLIPTSLIFISFIIDPIQYIMKQFGIQSVAQITEAELFYSLEHYIPQTFNWWLFGIGEVGLILFIIHFWRKNQVSKTE